VNSYNKTVETKSKAPNERSELRMNEWKGM